MKCRLTEQLSCIPCERFPDGILPIGTELEDPLAWVHIKNGNAEPADDEAEPYRQDESQTAAAQFAYHRTRLGIHPDDFAEYEAGIMVGYDQSDNKIPGPNFAGSLEDFESENGENEAEVL